MIKCIFTIFIILFSLSSFADYKIIMSEKVVKLSGVWSHLETQYGNWFEVGPLFDCSGNWSPDANTITSGTSFTQYQDCSQKEERTVTDIQEFSLTGETREVSKNNEERIVVKEKSQQAIGTKASFAHTFTNCGKTGRYGPNLTLCNNSYSGSSLLAGSNGFSVSNGIQSFRVPLTGNYRILVAGAQGGDSGINSGGKGALMGGDFYLIQDQKINILVGQEGINASYSGQSRGASGGGASYVFNDSSNKLLLVAGGGGGAGDNASGNAIHGRAYVHGYNSGYDNSDSKSVRGDGGLNGYGGKSGGYANYTYTGGGAGWYGNGGNATLGSAKGGQSLRAGGTGGAGYSGGKDGGFGGGGGSWAGSGGGGGYSGGGGGGWSPSYHGGGGGSYNSGTNQSNQSGRNNGHGSVEIVLIQ